MYLFDLQSFPGRWNGILLFQEDDIPLPRRCGLGLRRSQTTRFLLTIACDLHRGSREESYTIVCNRMESHLIKWNREESGAIISDLWTAIFHRIGLNKTSKYIANCYCKVPIDYNSLVKAFFNLLTQSPLIASSLSAWRVGLLICVCWYRQK